MSTFIPVHLIPLLQVMPGVTYWACVDDEVWYGPADTISELLGSVREDISDQDLAEHEYDINLGVMLDVALYAIQLEEMRKLGVEQATREWVISGLMRSFDEHVWTKDPDDMSSYPGFVTLWQVHEDWKVEVHYPRNVPVSPVCAGNFEAMA